MGNSIKYIVLVLFLICSSSETDQPSDHALIQALRSEDRNTIQIGLWTLIENDIKVPPVDLDKSYEEIQLSLEDLIDDLLQYPDSTLYMLDTSFYYYDTIYSPYYLEECG